MDQTYMHNLSESTLRSECAKAIVERDRIGLDVVVRLARSGNAPMRDLLVKSFIKYGLKASRKRCGDLFLDYVSWTTEAVDDAIRDYNGSSPFMSYLIMKFRNRINKGVYAESLIHIPENKIRAGVRFDYDELTRDDGDELYASMSKSDTSAERSGIRNAAVAICGGNRRDTRWLCKVILGDGAVHVPHGKRAVAVSRMRGIYGELKSRGMI